MGRAHHGGRRAHPGGCLRLTDEAGRERTYAFKEVKYVFDHREMP